jgi:hypothetical protein
MGHSPQQAGGAVTGIKHAVGAIGALALLAACGGGSDFADSSATTIQKEATKDMQALEAVHMEGSVNQQDTEIGLDLSLTTEGDCSGTVSRGDSGSAEVVTLNDTSWFKPDDEFWRAQAGDAAEQIISTVGDKWVQLPDGDQSFASFCDLDGLLDQFGADQNSDSKKGETGEVAGTEAIKLTRDAQEGGGTITVWVAVDDPHHILKVEQAEGDSPGSFTFSEFDQDASIEAPADDEVITVEELQKQTQQ